MTSAWLMAARPRTLLASVVPVMVGTAVAFAQGGADLILALAALVAAMLIQVATNFANDVYDFVQGADDDDRLGPSRAVHQGLLSESQMKRGMAAAFVMAAMIGAYLAYRSGAWVVWVGVLSIASGVAYTRGRHSLGYLGLGDFFVLLFFGFVAVCGTAKLQLGHVPALAIWASLPVGALATGILVVNNLRDMKTDERAQKRTLAVRFGADFAIWEYRVLIAVAYLVALPALAWLGFTFSALLPLVTLPFALGLIRRVAKDRGQTLNLLLADTAKLELFYGLTLAVGLVL